MIKGQGVDVHSWIASEGKETLLNDWQRQGGGNPSFPRSQSPFPAPDSDPCRTLLHSCKLRASSTPNPARPPPGPRGNPLAPPPARAPSRALVAPTAAAAAAMAQPLVVKKDDDLDEEGACARVSASSLSRPVPSLRACAPPVVCARVYVPRSALAAP